MKTIYLASGNAHKLHELQTALNLAGLPLTVGWQDRDEIGSTFEVCCSRQVEETGSTFETNALLAKAHGLTTKMDGPEEGWFLADDSGIEIDALDGRPRELFLPVMQVWNNDDEKNNDKVLQEMKDVLEIQFYRSL